MDSEPIPSTHLITDDERPLGDTPEAHDEVSPRDLLGVLERRIASVNSAVNALPTLCFDRAMWRKIPFRDVPRSVDSWFLRDPYTPAAGRIVLKDAQGESDEAEERGKLVGWLGHLDGLKPQLTVIEQLNFFAHLYGKTADITLLKGSGLLARLPAGVGALGDLAYVGIAEAHPAGLGAAPRRKPRGKPRPEADIAYNRAFARRRVVVEHTIGRLRRYAALTQPDRHHRRGHTARVRAAAGLVNRQLRRHRAA